jgi:hypothetical protein
MNPRKTLFGMSRFETPLHGPHGIGAMKNRTVMDRKVELTGGAGLGGGGRREVLRAVIRRVTAKIA